MPLGVGAQALGHLLGRALERRRAPACHRALDPPRAAGQPNEDRDRPLDLGRIATDVAARLVDDRRGAARRPSGRLPMSANQEFQASACGIVMRSIRGPFEPIISGGPPGRGPRGSSSQSRAW